MTASDTNLRDERNAPVSSRWLGFGVTLSFVFCLVASAIVISGRHYSGHRLGEYITRAVHARVDFVYMDKSKLAAAQQRARELEPRIYKLNPKFSWASLEEQMRRWPDMATARDPEALPQAMRLSLDSTAMTLLAQYKSPERKAIYNQRVSAFFAMLGKLVVIPAEQQSQEVARHTQWRAPGAVAIRVLASEQAPVALQLDQVFSTRPGDPVEQEIARAAEEAFREDLAPQVRDFILRSIQAPPADAGATHLLDSNETQAAQDRAAAIVLPREGEIAFKGGVLIKSPGEVDERDLGVLQAEHRAYRSSLGLPLLARDFAGIVGAVAVLTAVLGWYIRRYQPRVVRNHARAIAIAVLLVGMMLLSQLSAAGTRPLYVFGIAPTILTAIILGISYDPRFSLVISLLLATLTTLALNQGTEFLLILAAGCTATCAFTGPVRTRGRLIEIGIAGAMAMFAIAMFSGVWALDGARPFGYVLDDGIYAAIAGIAAGFVVLGILPFVEKAFRITTGMTLLEISDASHPLQRKMALETPGTYNHVLQVASLAEAAAEAIGADSLLARVGAIYHDIGKTKRPHYFCENQQGDNAHLALSPNVSFMIILEHIKDGIELARQYNLPTSLFPFIQQHHGTTLVEYFYHEACKNNRGAGRIEEASFRYPGPRPRSREIAIVMLADTCESACRAIPQATPETIEKLVHDLITKRLLDGQLSECDLTMRELAIVEKTLVRNLQSVHHGRIAYPDSSRLPAATNPPAAATGS